MKISDNKLKWDAALYQKSSLMQYQLALKAIERLDPKDGEDILEIGCGNAMGTIEIAKKIPNGTITAVEISDEMIQQAKVNLSQHEIKNVKIINMNAIDIEFEDQFNAVYSNSAIHWIPDLERMYAIIWRSLKKKGRIMIQTGLKEINVLVKAINKAGKFPEFKSHFKKIKNPWRFLTIQETTKILKKSGFQEIRAELYAYTMNFNDSDDLINYCKAAGLVPYLSALPEDLHLKFVDKFEEVILEMMPPGRFELGMERLFNYAKK